MAGRKLDVARLNRVDPRAGYLEAGTGLGDVIDALVELTRTRPLSFGAFAVGSAAAKVKTAAVLWYFLDGILRTKAATDDLWTLTGPNLPETGANCRKYLLCLDASGTATVLQSGDATTLAGCALPPYPTGKCVVGILNIVNTSVGAFVPGTTLLTVANVTDTYTEGDGGMRPLPALR